LKNSDYHGQISRRKYFVNKKNRPKRLAFARDNLHRSINFWNTVIFTDESKFNIFGSNGRRFVWRKANAEMVLKNLQPTVKYGGGSVMVWCCMSAQDV